MRAYSCATLLRALASAIEVASCSARSKCSRDSRSSPPALAGAEQLLRVSDRDLLPHLLAGAAEPALNRSDLPLATTRVDKALKASEASSDRLAEVAARQVAGRVAAASGQALVARTHFDRALMVAESLDSANDKSRVAFDYA